ncbi:MAG: hypothetical protein IPM57_09690 [Oligoflexia bacterium]|nr:hypothetical protein [Oligoflexia bacterium]
MIKLILLILCLGLFPTASFSQTSKNSKQLPLVFDPLTKKYFIGASSKFVLKESGPSQIVERIEVSVDGGDYKTYNDSIEFKEEGKHTLKFRAVSSVNNWSPVQFIEVFVDMSAPSTEIKFPDTKFHKNEQQYYYVAHNSELKLVAQDNLSGVAAIEYSWDGVNFNDYTKPIKLEKLGAQSIHYRSKDRVGNLEVTKKIDFSVDGTSPTSNLKIGQNPRSIFMNDRNYFSDGAAFIIESQDDLSKVKTVWVSIDGSTATPYLKPIYFLQEGPHTLKYFSEDFVGNRETEKTMNIYTVSTPPLTSLVASGKTINTGGVNFATKKFKIQLSAKDNAVGLERLEYKFNGDADFKPYIEPIEFKTEGLHTITYRAVDRVGTYGPSKTYTVNILEKGPETTISTAQSLVERNNTTYSPAPNVITFNVGNSAVGVDKTFVSINDGPLQLYQGPITLNSDQKVYKISYKSVDKLGNEEPPKTMTFHMISATPVIDLFVTSGQSSEEQVRTNYLDQPADAAKTHTPAAENAAPAPRKPANKAVNKR